MTGKSSRTTRRARPRPLWLDWARLEPDTRWDRTGVSGQCASPATPIQYDRRRHAASSQAVAVAVPTVQVRDVADVDRPWLRFIDVVRAAKPDVDEGTFCNAIEFEWRIGLGTGV
jgi:hypothetical protein